MKVDGSRLPIRLAFQTAGQFYEHLHLTPILATSVCWMLRRMVWTFHDQPELPSGSFIYWKHFHASFTVFCCIRGTASQIFFCFGRRQTPVYNSYQDSTRSASSQDAQATASALLFSICTASSVFMTTIWSIYIAFCFCLPPLELY